MTFIGLQNYSNLMQDSVFWDSLLKTLLYTAMFVPMIFCFSLLLALFVNIVNYSTVSGFIPTLLKDSGASNFQMGLGTTLGLIPVLIMAPLSCTVMPRKVGFLPTIVLGFLFMSIPVIATRQVSSSSGISRTEAAMEYASSPEAHPAESMLMRRSTRFDLMICGTAISFSTIKCSG
jgi:ABC-type spermidine/putrescine transport system permease subunit I